MLSEGGSRGKKASRLGVSSLLGERRVREQVHGQPLERTLTATGIDDGNERRAGLHVEGRHRDPAVAAAAVTDPVT